MPYFSVSGKNGITRKLYYHESGSGDVLFFIHGWFQNSLEVFNPYLSHFSGKYRVIAPDLPGHGLSYRDKTVMYSIEEAYFVLVRFLEYLKKESKNIYLVGCSLGAYLALEIAVKNPDLVDNITLISVFLDFKQNELEIENMLKLSPLGLRINLWIRAQKEMFPFGGRNLSYWSINGKPPGKWKHMRQKLNNHPLHAAKGYITSFLNASLMKIFHENELPTLLIYGEKDGLTPRDFATSLANRMLRTKLQIVERAGHDVYFTHVSDVITLIEDFLKENKKRKIQWFQLFWKR